MSDKQEQEIPLNWTRRRGRPAKRKPTAEAPPRIPRIARLMALAIKFQGMVDRGEVRDYADLARLGYVTRARITQIMNMLNLAPDIQEEILGIPVQLISHRTLAERQIRQIARTVQWSQQRCGWATLTDHA
ncbi:MAG: hypothetical protein P4M05_03350 [Bradyrhizobium sp.]|nr:hypothetical protein [Bradyrhizobium sp.]